ncbi:hypothetical protein SESBI_33289 [Sesbania bispinosa]|nr:hypothetical protein SESBI_33289 [Sesbania bispinosa]
MDTGEGGGALRHNEDRDEMFDEPVKTELRLAEIKPAEKDEAVVRLVAWSAMTWWCGWRLGAR